MKLLIEFLIRHGYAVLFSFVLAEQMGLPVPAVPVLLGVGALIGQGHFRFTVALLLSTGAAVMADIVWYHMGRFRGAKILALLCRLSLEPDSCVRRSTDTLERVGPRSLLFAKFVPGLSTVAPPLAGMARVPMLRFIFWDLAGSLVWAGAFLFVGILFSSELEHVADWALRFGWALGILVALGLSTFLGWKYIQRRRVLRSLRVARITPEELKHRLEAGEPVTIIDLRHPVEQANDPIRLPGALRYAPDEVERLGQLLLDRREVVLYCT